MNNLELSLPHDQTGFDPGAEISASVAWNFASAPSAIEVRLVWNTSGKGDRDLKVVKTIRIDSPSNADSQIVPLQLPWGPYSFSGRLISLIWAIEVVALPGKESLRKEITMAPKGSEVLIGSVK